MGKPMSRATSSLSLATVAGLLLASGGTAQTLRGYLRDAESGQPIYLALIVMFTEPGDSVGFTITNQQGYFSIGAPEPGSFLLRASALGYGETTDGIFDLGEGAEMTIDFRVEPEPLQMEELLVGVDREVLEHVLVRNGFVARLRASPGRFLTPVDLAKSPALSTEDLLARVPRVLVRPSTGPFVEDVVLMRGNGGRPCVPYLYVDGFPLEYKPGSGFSLSAFAPLMTVLAVEIYRGPSEVPPEFDRSRGGEVCGAIVIWTRMGR